MQTGNWAFCASLHRLDQISSHFCSLCTTIDYWSDAVLSYSILSSYNALLSNSSSTTLLLLHSGPANTPWRTTCYRTICWIFRTLPTLPNQAQTYVSMRLPLKQFLVSWRASLYLSSIPFLHPSLFLAVHVLPSYREVYSYGHISTRDCSILALHQLTVSVSR